MKNIIISGFFLLVSLAAFAQQSVLNGIVTVFNSQFETGKKQYISNAQVEDDFKKSQATTTNNEGVFKLPLVGIKDLDKVFFNVKKANYEVVNTDALQAVAGQKEPVQVFMALEGVIAENKRKYYEINLSTSEKALTEKLVQLAQQIEALQQDKEANKTKIEALQLEYERLQKSFKEIDETARELAERYAKTNLDNASAEYQKAFRYFQRGLLDSALVVFQKMDLEQITQKVVSEQNRTVALKTEYETRNTEKNKQKMQTVESLKFKADLHQIILELNQVKNCYELILQLDSTDVSILQVLGAINMLDTEKDKAISFFNKALFFSKSDADKIKTFNTLGMLYAMNDDSTNTKNAFEEAFKRSELLYKIDSVKYLDVFAEVHLGLIGYYNSFEEDEKIGYSISKSLEMFKLLAKKDIESYGAQVLICQTLLGLWLIKKNMVKADSIIKETLGFFAHYSKNKNELMKTYCYPLLIMGLAEMANFKKDYKSADSLYTQAINSLSRIHDGGLSYFEIYNAQAYYALAKCAYEQRDYEKAENAFIKSIELWQLLLEKNQKSVEINLAYSYFDLGLAFSAKNEFEKAKNVYILALKIKKRLAKIDPKFYEPDVAFTLTNLASACLSNKDSVESQLYYEEALSIYNILEKPNFKTYELNVASIQFWLGIIYGSNRKFHLAEEAFNEAAKIYRFSDQQAIQNYDAIFSRILHFLGVAYFLENKLFEAEKNLLEAFEIREKCMMQNPTTDTQFWLETLNYLNTTYQKMVEIAQPNLAKLKPQEKLVALFEKYIQYFPSDKNANSIGAQNYGGAAFFYLFSKQFALSEQAALKGLSLDPTQEWIKTNLAHAFLFQSQFSEAERIYFEFKSRKDRFGKLYKDILLEDFKAFESEGITHADMPRMKVEIEKW